MKKFAILTITIVCLALYTYGCKQDNSAGFAALSENDTASQVTKYANGTDIDFNDKVWDGDNDYLRQDERPIDALIVHCSASGEDEVMSADSVRRLHRSKGWDDIGYHFYITRDGAIHEGRPVAVTGAHVKGHNETTIGICYEGGLRRTRDVKGYEGIKVPANLRNAHNKIFTTMVNGEKTYVTVLHGIPYVPRDTRTDAQKASLIRILKALHAVYPDAQIKGHRDMSPDKNHDGKLTKNEWVKDCPSFYAEKEYSSIMN